LHAPEPSQAEVPIQAGVVVPRAALVHRPGLALQVWQTPLQALLQHCPPLRHTNPELHWLLVVQAAHWARVPTPAQ
jgi:hypothetical protein